MRYFPCKMFLAFAFLSLGQPAGSAAESVAPAMAKILPKPHTGDLDSMIKLRLIRILVPYSKTVYFLDKGRQFGTAVEFGTALETELNKGKKKEIDHIRIAFIPTSRDQLIPALNGGRGDIVMANLTITPTRLEQVDFSAPIYDEAAEVLVTGPSASAIASLDELSGKSISVRQTDLLPFVSAFIS